jgi:hypothetical protein
LQRFGRLRSIPVGGWSRGHQPADLFLTGF